VDECHVNITGVVFWIQAQVVPLCTGAMTTMVVLKDNFSENKVMIEVTTCSHAHGLLSQVSSTDQH